jgi:hypothetical protein
MFQIPVDSVVNCVSFHRRRNDDPPLIAIFPLAYTNFVSVKHKCSSRIANMVSESVNRRFKVCSQGNTAVERKLKSEGFRMRIDLILK